MAGSPIVLRGQAEATIIPPLMSPGCVWEKEVEQRKNTSASLPLSSIDLSFPLTFSLWEGWAAIGVTATVTDAAPLCRADIKLTKYGQKTAHDPSERTMFKHGWDALKCTPGGSLLSLLTFERQRLLYMKVLHGGRRRKRKIQDSERLPKKKI